MAKKLFIISVLAAVIIAGYIFLGLFGAKRSSVNFEKISINSSINMNKKKKKGRIFNDPTQERIGREIDYAWDNIHLGNEFSKRGEYEQAAEAFKKAYAVDLGPKTMVGLDLIETYEKLNSYDEALLVLDDLQKKYIRGEYGLQKALQIRTRLLAAKANAFAGNQSDSK